MRQGRFTEDHIIGAPREHKSDVKTQLVAGVERYRRSRACSKRLDAIKASQSAIRIPRAHAQTVPAAAIRLSVLAS
jgi:hypothetical protein